MEDGGDRAVKHNSERPPQIKRQIKATNKRKANAKVSGKEKKVDKVKDATPPKETLLDKQEDNVVKVASPSAYLKTPSFLMKT